MKGSDTSAECVALFEEKRDLLRSVLEVTSRQQGFLDAEEYTTKLMDNLEERQRLIDEINAVDEKLRAHVPYPHDQALLALADEQRALLMDIMKQDDANEKAAKEHMQELKDKLRKLQEGKRGIEAYDPIPSEQAATYIDKRN